MFENTRKDELFMRRLMTSERIKQLLEMLYFYDEETYEHSIRVAYIAMHMYDAAVDEGYFDVKKTNKKYVVAAALLHDIGKMFVPHSILHKKSGLTEEEFRVIQQHPKLGADMARIYLIPEVICEMIENHHKKMDGSGYPYNGNFPSEGALLVSAADIFSAITEKRSYKDREDVKTGIDIIYSEIEEGHIPEAYGEFLESIIDNLMAVS
ncbi:MAG: HD domain-containing protein [Butyrivibrio sp.]|uniref:HD-GYP domain-containing protein n=1 Tax=Butyrivibrio sp. TaxID=28121 RepID=UPI001B775F91|nr:HD domain-containing phosphohydrolase [Butyrivibrio sp.]MBP3784460.1 HD domain-containing protein [Butyrivibrio sp.]